MKFLAVFVVAAAAASITAAAGLPWGAADPPVTVHASSAPTASSHKTNVSGTIKTQPSVANGSFTAEIEGPGPVKQTVHGTLDAKGEGTFNFGLTRPPAKKGQYKITVTAGKAPNTVKGSTTVNVTFAPPERYVIMQGKLAGLIIGADVDGTVHPDDNPGDESKGKIVKGEDGVIRFEGASSNEVLKNGNPAKFNVKVEKLANLSPAFLSVAGLANTEIVTRSYLREKPPKTGYAWYEFSHGNQIVPPIDKTTGKLGDPPVKKHIKALGESGALTAEQVKAYSDAIDTIRNLDKETFDDLKSLQQGFKVGDAKKTPLGPKGKEALVESALDRLTKTIRLKQEILRAVIESNTAVRCPESRNACPPPQIAAVGTWAHNASIGRTRVCLNVTTTPKQAFVSTTVTGPSGSASLPRSALSSEGKIQLRTVVGLAGVYTWTVTVYNAAGAETAIATFLVTVQPPPTEGPVTSPACAVPTE